MAYDSNIHGMVNVAKANGTDAGIDLYSGMVYSSESFDVLRDCDNGMLVNFGAVKTLDTSSDPDGIEVYRVYPNNAKSVPRNRLGLVATPEMIYDESKHYTLENFYNEAGKPVRIYHLTPNSIFTFNAKCFSNVDVNDLTVGKYVTYTNATFTAQDSEPIGDDYIGVIEKVLYYDTETQYVVRIY